MNLTEGTRRLSLLLGAVGATLCCLLSFGELQSDMRQKAEHQRFEQLVNSPLVRQERRTMQELAPGIIPQTGEDWFEQNAPTYAPRDAKPSTFASGEIKTINWTWNFEISSLELADGQTLYPTPARGAWSYGLIVILPLLGFFIPWGIVRAVGWAVAGFVQPVK